MASGAVPKEFREKLRWLPDPPYHVPLVRRVMEVLVRLGRAFEFEGDDRVEAYWVHPGEASCKVYRPVERVKETHDWGVPEPGGDD